MSLGLTAPARVRRCYMFARYRRGNQIVEQKKEKPKMGDNFFLGPTSFFEILNLKLGRRHMQSALRYESGSTGLVSNLTKNSFFLFGCCVEGRGI